MASPGGFDFGKLSGRGQTPPPAVPTADPASGNTFSGDPSSNPFGSPPSPGNPFAAGPGGAGQPWGDPVAGGRVAAPRVPAGPPLGLLWVATVLCVLALVVAALSFRGYAVYAAGWFVAGPVALVVLASFARRDAVRQTLINYGASEWVAKARLACVVLALVGIVANAARIAYWIGHQ